MIYNVIPLILRIAGFVSGILFITKNKYIAKYFIRERVKRLRNSNKEESWILEQEKKLEKQASKILYIIGWFFIILPVTEIISDVFFPLSDSFSSPSVIESEAVSDFEWWWNLAGKIIFSVGFLYVLKYYGYIKWSRSKK